jgi:hypothetical protein
MVPVTVSGQIIARGCLLDTNTAAYAVKDEYGLVQPSGLVALDATGGYSFTVLLEASRLGRDINGRRYTIAVHVSDNAGNTGSQAKMVTVSHDQEH